MMGVGSSRGIDTSLEVQVGPEDTVYVAYVMTVPGKPSYPWSRREKVIELVLLETTVQFLWSYPTLPPCSVSSPPCSFSGMWEVTPLNYKIVVSFAYLRGLGTCVEAVDPQDISQDPKHDPTKEIWISNTHTVQ